MCQARCEIPGARRLKQGETAEAAGLYLGFSMNYSIFNSTITRQKRCDKLSKFTCHQENGPLLSACHLKGE